MKTQTIIDYLTELINTEKENQFYCFDQAERAKGIHQQFWEHEMRRWQYMRQAHKTIRNIFKAIREEEREEERLK